MKNAGLRQEEFLDREALDDESTRVFEKCHDCRRCLPLCPSFPALFDAIDAHDLDARRMTSSERQRVSDLCYDCKLCYNHCPYHPPHEWAIDFPKLMMRAKLVQAEEKGLKLADQIGQRQDLIGKCSCLAAPITNALYRVPFVRRLMEIGTGIDRRFVMPSYESRPLSRQLKGRGGRPGESGRVVLFGTCFVEYSGAATGRAALAVLEHNGVEVEYRYQACCGAPFLHGGDVDAARKSAAAVVADLVPHVREGKKVVVTGPTCSYQLKHEYPELLATDDARAVAEHTQDIFEYLWSLRGRGTLNRDFKQPLGRVAYHLPCHLKAQNVGFRSMQFLKGAGADVSMMDHCSGVDGTWGMKKKHYEESLLIARKLLQDVRDLEPDRIATDCPLSALRILEGTGRVAEHPIILIRDAYGLEAS